VRQPTFTYHRTRVSTVRLSANRRAFATRPRRTIVIRTSIGPLAPALLDITTGGAVLTAVSGRGFAGPVVWCCTQGEERVLYSDGRPDAARPVAVAVTPRIARALVRSGPSLTLIERLADGGVRRQPFAAFGPLPLALDRRDVAGPLAGGAAIVRAPVSAAGPIALPVPLLARPAPAGRVTALHLDGPAMIALVRRGRLWEVYRYTGTTSRRLLWRSRTRPARLAAGGGRVVVAAGRTFWTGRGASRLRPTHRAAGAVRALAVDRTRFAWMERRGARLHARLGRLR
jgi:hypothetical protein